MSLPFHYSFIKTATQYPLQHPFTKTPTSQNPIKPLQNPNSVLRRTHQTTAAAAPTMSFGLKSLTETFVIDVEKAEGRPLNVPLTAPFAIASSRLDSVENMAIRVELRNGCAGWGETPILPSVTAEDQITALEKVGEACVALRRARGRTLGSVLRELGESLPGHEFASVPSTSPNPNISPQTSKET